MRPKSYQQPKRLHACAFYINRRTELARLPDGLCDEFRNVLGVLARVDLGRHLAVALERPLLIASSTSVSFGASSSRFGPTRATAFAASSV